MSVQHLNILDSSSVQIDQNFIQRGFSKIAGLVMSVIRAVSEFFSFLCEGNLTESDTANAACPPPVIGTAPAENFGYGMAFGFGAGIVRGLFKA